MEERKPNWFVRVSVAALSLLLLSLVVYKFFWMQPPGDLGVGVLALIALVVVLVLSESFDTFSVGKLLSLSREVKKKDTEATALKKENIELRNQLVAVANSVTQHQSSTNTIVTVPEALARAFAVTKAPEGEARAQREGSACQFPLRFEAHPGTTRRESNRRRLRDSWTRVAWGGSQPCARQD